MGRLPIKPLDFIGLFYYLNVRARERGSGGDSRRQSTTMNTDSRWIKHVTFWYMIHNVEMRQKKTPLTTANQVSKGTVGVPKACFDCLVWCRWLAACGEHSSLPGHHWPHPHTHTHTQYNRIPPTPNIEVKYAWILRVGRERAINQYPEWNCMCLFLLMCWLTAHTHPHMHKRFHLSLRVCSPGDRFD